MIKQSSILALLSLCVTLQAAHPLAEAFEAQGQRPMVQPDRQEGMSEEDQAKLMYATQILLAQNSEISEENARLSEVNAKLSKKNKKLLAKIDQVLEDANPVLKQKIDELDQNNKDLFWILLGSTAAAGVTGAAVPQKVAEIIESSKDPNSTLRTRMLPDFLQQLLSEQELNKTITGATAQGIHVELNTQQLVDALYHTLNTSSAQIIKNFAPDMVGEDVTALTKEDLSRLLAKNIALALLQRGIQLTDDKVLLQVPGHKAIILRKSQLKEVGCAVGARAINDLYARRPIAPGELGAHCATHVGTQVGYNTLVQLTHLIAEKTNTKHSIVDHILPKDCKPNNMFSLYAKMLIGWGVQVGATMAAPGVKSAALTAARWAISRYINIPFH